MWARLYGGFFESVNQPNGAYVPAVFSMNSKLHDRLGEPAAQQLIDLRVVLQREVTEPAQHFPEMK